MTRKILLDIDPGIADTLALCLALENTALDLVAVTATGGNTTPEQASLNVQAIIEQLDSARLPRIGAADPNQPLRTDGRDINGPNGLCGADFRVAELHHQHPSEKVIAEEIRAAAGELTIIAGGPLTNLAKVFQLEPDLATQVGHLIIVGGTLSGPGNISAAAEFNIYCDAEAARYVFRSPVTKTLLPLDVSSEVVLDYGVLDSLPPESAPVGGLLRAILPGAFRTFRQRLGLEGIYVPEAVAVIAALHPELFMTEPMVADVETSGELTYGATVLDRRHSCTKQPNMDVIFELDTPAATDAILRCL